MTATSNAERHDISESAPTARHSEPSIREQAASVRTLLRQGQNEAAEAAAAALIATAPTEVSSFVLFARCAAARADWQEAVRRWFACSDRFATEPSRWRLGLAQAFSRTGEWEKAAAAFAAELAENPDSEAALVGRASAASRTDPIVAEALWRDLLAGPMARLRLDWRVAHARALADLGKSNEAYDAVRSLLSEGPAAPRGALKLLARLLIQLNLRAEAERELEFGLLRRTEPATDLDRLPLLAWLRRGAEARLGFEAAFRDASSLVELAMLFATAPRILDPYRLESFWRALRARLDAIHWRAELDATLLQLRLDLALRDYPAFLARFASAPVLPVAWDAPLRRVAEVLNAPRFPDLGAPKVFGIGLSKTGTSSLGQALDRLGFLQAHFYNTFSMNILSDDDFALFDAATDTPVSTRFETLYHLYPNARFVLTERPYDSWERSLRGHFEKWFGSSSFPDLAARLVSGESGLRRDGFALVHGSLYYSHPDPKAAYEAHRSRVEGFFADKPANKLLRHNVFAGDGWPELCGFLGLPTPAAPYPWVNRVDVSSED
jgi:hypothetical protein